MVRSPIQLPVIGPELLRIEPKFHDVVYARDIAITGVPFVRYDIIPHWIWNTNPRKMYDILIKNGINVYIKYIFPLENFKLNLW